MSSDFVKLKFILEKIDDLDSFLARYDSLGALLEDKMGFDATLMCLLQIGETLNKLENEYAELDKSDIKGAYEVRNFIAHDYEGVDKAIVENVIRRYIPILKVTIETIIKKETQK